MDDFLALGPLIKSRLRELLPPEVFILDAQDLAGVMESQQPASAVHVLYGGHAPKTANAAWEDVEQIWHTVIVVRNVAGLPGVAPGNQDAGPLIMQVIKALRPWVPGIDAAGSLHLANPLRTAFKAGFGYYPLAWKTTLRVPVRPART